MANEKAVIIGGSSGMGLASARRLAAEGYAVVVSARSQARIAQAVAQIGSGATGFPLDYAERSGITAFFEVVGSFDHLLLAGAGPAAWGAFGDLKGEVLSGAFDSKFWGYFHCLQAALPTIRKDGSVTLITGAAARAAIPGTAGLAAVNGAIEMVPSSGWRLRWPRNWRRCASTCCPRGWWTRPPTTGCHRTRSEACCKTRPRSCQCGE